jgi:hypothetical protein
LFPASFGPESGSHAFAFIARTYKTKPIHPLILQNNSGILVKDIRDIFSLLQIQTLLKDLSGQAL